MSGKVETSSGAVDMGTAAGRVGAERSAPSSAPLGQRSYIGSVRLRVAAMSSTEASALARAIGQGLAARVAELRPISGGTLRIQVPADSGMRSVLALADEVIGRVFQAMHGGQEEG